MCQTGFPESRPTGYLRCPRMTGTRMLQKLLCEWKVSRFNKLQKTSEIFKVMWKTIRNKQTWQGILKNRAKDASTVYVDTTITPHLRYHSGTSKLINTQADNVPMIIRWPESLNIKGKRGQKRSELVELRDQIGTSLFRLIFKTGICHRLSTTSLPCWINYIYF